jgi:hypothetical protein
VSIGRGDKGRGKKCHAKGSTKETKIQEFTYREVWNMKCMIIPVITGATGTETKLRSHTRKTFKYIYYRRQLYLEQHT